MSPEPIYTTNVKRRLYFSKSMQIQTKVDPTGLDKYAAGLQDTSKDHFASSWALANLITSIKDSPENLLMLTEARIHYPVLDLDFNCGLIPSSNPNKFHLYLDKPLSWSHYKKLLDVLAEVGIIEPGYAEASKNKGFTAVRRPGILKKNKHQDDLGANRYKMAQRVIYNNYHQSHLLKEIKDTLTQEQFAKLSPNSRALLNTASYTVDPKLKAAQFTVNNVEIPKVTVTVSHVNVTQEIMEDTF